MDRSSDTRSSAGTHYETLGVPMDAPLDVVRRAYRAHMRSLHPDSNRGSGAERLNLSRRLTQLSEAWRILSSADTRAEYDAGLVLSAEPLLPPPPAPQTARSRREAWVFGVRSQIVHLASRAGKSATQTLLLRDTRATRAEYDELVEELVARIAADTEARVRAARAAGAAPLDLGVAATLLGIRAVADELRRASSQHRTVIESMEADLLDRMWDVLAHELPITLTGALGGNPGVAKLLRSAG
ncbi:MAG: J domain-containing protein [Acidimicrobiales bacterium]|nr:J domain-containing protein [Acidimicrobiales bacterium]